MEEPTAVDARREREARRRTDLTGARVPLAHLRRSMLGLWIVALFAITLLPGPLTGPVDEAIGAFCIVCGERGTADGLLNLLLFVPIGLAIPGRRHPVLAAISLGTVLSLAIELAQNFVPGRYPTFGDVVWNGLGAGAGALLLLGLGRHFAAPGRWVGRVGAVLAGTVLAAAGWLLEHAPTESVYFGQWTPDLGHMPQYEGSLVSAELDGLEVPNTRFPLDLRPAERIAGDWRLDVRMVKGRPPPAVSPIVSIYDADETEILLLGAHGDDIVLRERTRAHVLSLDAPDLRLRGALASIGVGDTVSIGARREGHDRCVSVEGFERCGLGFTPGRTWGVLLYPEGSRHWARGILDVAWLSALLFPVGALATSARAVATNGAVVAALTTVAVWLTRLHAPPWWEVIGGLVGLGLGWLVNRAASGSAGRAALPPTR